MKSFFVITAIMAVLGLTSCEKEASEAIVGTWESVRMEMQIEGVKMEMDMKEMGISMVFTFRADGTGTINEMIEGEEMSSDFNYRVDGGMLVVYYEDEEAEIPVTVDGKNMTIVIDGELMEELGSSVTIHFEKK